MLQTALRRLSIFDASCGSLGTKTLWINRLRSSNEKVIEFCSLV